MIILLHVRRLYIVFGIEIPFPGKKNLQIRHLDSDAAEMLQIFLFQSLARSDNMIWDVCVQILVLRYFNLDLASGGYLQRLEPNQPRGLKHLEPRLNYLLLHQLQKMLTQPIRRHGKRQSVAALGSLAWCGGLSSVPADHRHRDSLTTKVLRVGHCLMKILLCWNDEIEVVWPFLVSPGQKSQGNPFSNRLDQRRISGIGTLAPVLASIATLAPHVASDGDPVTDFRGGTVDPKVLTPPVFWEHD